MYSLIRSLIGANDARMQIHVRVVVRTTRIERQPVDADAGTGSRTAGSTAPAPRTGSAGGTCGSKPMIRSSETTHAARPSARASGRA